MSVSLTNAERVLHLEDRLRILSSAPRDFAEAVSDYERLLDVIARKLALVVKDGCVVRLLSDGGWLTPVAIHMPIEKRVTDPAMLAQLRAHMNSPHNLSEHDAGRRVIETGEALLVPKFDATQVRSSATREVARAFETMGIHSLLFVALRARGMSIGLLALTRFEPTSPPFGEQDLEMAQALADHAALAITNSRLLQSALHELSERKRAEAVLERTEEQLRHAQKMEAIGRLAGGVAHDFNNILSVILSYSEMVSAALAPDEPLRADVEEIRIAGKRAADLTHHLLAFSRQQVLEPKILNLNQSVTGVEKMLRRLLGAGVDMTTLCAADLGNVKADASQVEQVIVNLAVNARDAMPEGGKLTIETANVELDEDYARGHHGVKPGPHVMLAVTDSGVGFDKATQAKIFEPFFTTKDRGKGTGLGLATVFGIVKQSGGHIWIYSEVGKGTTFKVYFPRAEGEAETRAPEVSEPDSNRGTGTILLVEDDEQVRALAVGVLRRQGYTVLEAPNAGEAILICEQHAMRIHLLLTDVVLPRMSGPLLAERLFHARPDMKVLFMSGYTDDAVLQHGVLDSGLNYLQKPITPRTLAKKVRDVLQGRAGKS